MFPMTYMCVCLKQPLFLDLCTWPEAVALFIEAKLVAVYLILSCSDPGAIRFCYQI